MVLKVRLKILCLWSSALIVKLFVQRSELFQEAGVGTDVPAGADYLDGLDQSHALMDQQVRQHQGSGETQAHGTVDKHLT